MADDRPAIDIPDDPDVRSSGPNPFHVVARRWPLLLVGLLAGVVLGALIHLTSRPAYQSSAQVLVLKKRADTSAAVDGRTAAVEDYVSTQVTILKSERIRRLVAKELNDKPLREPLPADERVGAAMLAAGVGVSRERDPTSPTQSVGSGVLNLSYRGGNPSDTKIILDALIYVYKKELYALYEQSTEDRLAYLNKSIELTKNLREQAAVDQLRLKDELRNVTTEEINSIRVRVSAERDREQQLESDRLMLADQMDLMNRVKDNDRRDRQALYTMLTGSMRMGLSVSGEAGIGTAESNLRLFESQRKAKSADLGKDHPQMRELDQRISYFKEELARLNPRDPTGTVDELDAYKTKTELQLRSVEKQLKDLRQRISTDEAKLTEGGRIQDQINLKGDDITRYDRDLSRLQSEKLTVEATRNVGGYSAQEITEPNDGVKVAPVLLQSLLMGLAVGLLLGGAGMAVAELTDKGFRSPAEIRRRLGLPVIGHLPQLRIDQPRDPAALEKLDAVLVTAVRPKSSESEGYRGVRTQLYFSTQGRGHQVVQVTSPSPGDGKSTLAANLAISIAQSGKRVVLVDCDFRKPRVHKLFGVESEDGVAKVVSGEVPMSAGLRRSGVENLDLLPCGVRPANPAELLTSPGFQNLLADLRAAYDFVIIDTPPLLAVSDPAAVAPRVDGVILVFRLTNNARPAAERAREQLAALGANVLGVVVNGFSGTKGGYSGGYNYGYAYGGRYSGYGYRYADYEYADHYEDAPSGEFNAPKA